MDTMPITYDIKRDIRYNQGKTEGESAGIVKGIIKGKLEGKLEEKQKFIIRLLKTGNYANESIANLADTSVDFVNRTQAAYEKGLQMTKDEKYSVQDVAKATGLMQEVIEIFFLSK